MVAIACPQRRLPSTLSPPILATEESGSEEFSNVRSTTSNPLPAIVEIKESRPSSKGDARQLQKKFNDIWINLTDHAEERVEIGSALVTQRDLLLISFIHG